MERKNLDKYLAKTNLQLLSDFKWGIQGQNDFGQFMNLVREQQEENKELNRKIQAVYDIYADI